MSNAHLSSPGVSLVFMMQKLGDDKAHCEPTDKVKTNQWVCALTLLFGVHLNFLDCNRIQIHSRLDSIFYVFS